MLNRIKKAVTDSLFPNKCQACGQFFHPNESGRTPHFSIKNLYDAPVDIFFQRVMAPFLCPICLIDFSAIRSPFCTRCGRMFKGRTGIDHQCEDCIKKKKTGFATRSAGIYGGSLMSLIHAFKYHGKVQLARPLGRLLFYAVMHYYDIKTFDLIMPIPLHISRLKHRGFNQAIMILNEWPQLFNETDESESSVFVDKKSLIRNRKTISQTGLGKEKRKQNVKNAFTVTDPQKISKNRILLVDDVYTTGATSEECAKILTANGAKTVNVLTLARAD